MTNTKTSLSKRIQTAPNWLPVELYDKYDESDLTYEFCIKLFAQLEAAKREKFPPETMRIWFIEFIKRGWTKVMLQKRYDILLTKPIYGVEKLEFADWVNATTEIYAGDEIEIIINRRINTRIRQGNGWLNLVFPKIMNEFQLKNIKINERQEENIRLAVLTKVKESYQAQRFRYFEEKMEEYKKYYLKIIGKRKTKIKKLNLDEREKLLNRLYDENIISQDPKSHTINLNYLEMFAELIPDNYLEQND